MFSLCWPRRYLEDEYQKPAEMNNETTTSVGSQETEVKAVSESMMASNVSKHKFQWSPDDPDSHHTLKTKIFHMRVLDRDVKCIAALFKAYNYDSSNQQTFYCELTWTDCRNQPLLYSCEVHIRDIGNGKVLWSDKKASPYGRHVASSEVFPKLAIRMNSWVAVKIDFSFEFDLQDGAVKENSTSMTELAMPLFKENVLSDVIVECGEKTFDCHKFVLAARSEVFKTMLTGSFKEGNENKIVIKDCDPEVAKLMIEFIYSDHVAEDAISWDLFEMAKMYELHRLKVLCLRRLRKNLDVNNCCKMLEATCVHDLDDLFDLAMEFFKKNKCEVAKTEYWKNISVNHIVLAKMALHP